MSRFFIIIFLFLTSFIFAQTDISIGQWKGHLSEKSFHYLTQSETTLYLATPLSYIEMDKSDGSQRSHSRLNGLTHSNVSFVKYDKTTKALIVIYNNSSFDVVDKNGNITSFSAIQTDGNFLARAINDIYIDDNGLAHFACKFGVVIFDLKEYEFVETYDFQTSVNGITKLNDTLYVASDDGIFYGNTIGNLNLQDINEWSYFDIEDGFPAVYSSNAICSKFNSIYFDVNDTVFVKTTDGLEKIVSEDEYGVKYITAEGAGVLIGLVKNEGKLYYLDEQKELTELPSSCTGAVGYGIEDEKGTFWIGSKWHDLREISNKNATNCKYHKINAPYSSSLNDVAIKNEVLCIATAFENHLAPDNKSGFFTLEDGLWKRYGQNNKYLKEKDAAREHNKAIFHPKDNRLYVSSFWGGLIEKDGDKLKVYNSENSALQKFGNNTRVAGIAFDKDANLWMANSSAQKPICVMKEDGTWNNFDVTSSPDLRDMIIDSYGNKWFVVFGQGIFVFNENGTFDDKSDDKQRFININDNLPDNHVNGMALDLNGDVWVGTTDGAVVFECGSLIMEKDCKGSKRIIDSNEFDDENAYLLSGENINTIAVDGANRKWFGTDNGVFVLSSSGQEQVAQFDTKNSPLPDNVIRDIEIDPNSGEVYIGTRQGLVVYRSDATGAKKFHSTNVTVFPNPVRPDYSGVIAIKGLAENSNVKITDVTGKLFYETKALGGQAIWDGKDYNGRIASTGVYLVFGTNADNSAPESIVSKILFVK